MGGSAQSARRQRCKGQADLSNPGVNDATGVWGERLPRIIAVHKPRGVVVSRVRQGGAPTLFELLPEQFRQFYAVGRLDKDSEGLILLCDTSWVAQRLMDPGVLPKTYLVTVRGLPNDATLDRLRAGGLELNGRRTRPAEVSRLGKAPRGGTRLRVVLHEGINRQIRRCFHALGHRVRRLLRVAVGPVTLGELQPGQLRELSRTEVVQLLAEAGLLKGETEGWGETYAGMGPSRSSKNRSRCKKA